MKLDNFSKKVLKHFISNDKEYTINTIFNDLNLKSDDEYDKLEKSLNILLECNLIRFRVNQLAYKSYLLTNAGRHFFSINRSNFFFKYLYPIVLSVTTLLLSLILK